MDVDELEKVVHMAVNVGTLNREEEKEEYEVLAVEEEENPEATIPIKHGQQDLSTDEPLAVDRSSQPEAWKLFTCGICRQIPCWLSTDLTDLNPLCLENQICRQLPCACRQMTTIPRGFKPSNMSSREGKSTNLGCMIFLNTPRTLSRFRSGGTLSSGLRSARCLLRCSAGALELSPAIGVDLR
ncbi:hypothetical protein Taro_042596 [Colocasia esculenta]|uniref:Uncharacterized protein n=1 Tax=Colocasia esculenta TaxID=4460 RepID=A0A843WT95_COLES|nr:hypothetical protein [Colocasia esculenta]